MRAALTVEEVEPGLRGAALDKAVAMVLFGMMNWTFTWLRPEGALSYVELARVVTRIFLHGIAGFAAKRRICRMVPPRPRGPDLSARPALCAQEHTEVCRC